MLYIISTIAKKQNTNRSVQVMFLKFLIKLLTQIRGNKLKPTGNNSATYSSYSTMLTANWCSSFGKYIKSQRLDCKPTCFLHIQGLPGVVDIALHSPWGIVNSRKGSCRRSRQGARLGFKLSVNLMAKQILVKRIRGIRFCPVPNLLAFRPTWTKFHFNIQLSICRYNGNWVAVLLPSSRLF